MRGLEPHVGARNEVRAVLAGGLARVSNRGMDESEVNEDQKPRAGSSQERPATGRREPAAQRPAAETGRRDGAHEVHSRTPSRNVSAQAQISKIQDAGDAFTRKIELEKRRIDELDRQMEAVRKRIWEQRESMGGINASRENTAAITKQIAILENRLDTSLKKYNEAVARNKRQRESIDGLRRERLVFEQGYAKLEREVAEKKREMARTIEASNQAYAARDAAQLEMAGLKAQAEREQAEFETEWEELGRMVEHDRRMKAFIAQVRA